ncbi:putative PetM of cytochrome b6/f complex subunit 7 [Helianthus anomalus]
MQGGKLMVFWGGKRVKREWQDIQTELLMKIVSLLDDRTVIVASGNPPKFSNPIPNATLSPVTFTATAITTPTRSTPPPPKVTYIKGFTHSVGLKPTTPSTPVSTEQQFANSVCSLKKPSSRGGAGGGALTSTCKGVGEIFKITVIMNGITLVGVAIGLVLLRIEASVEESELAWCGVGRGGVGRWWLVVLWGWVVAGSGAGGGRW